MLMSSIKQCLKRLLVKKKHIPIIIMSVSAYVNVITFYVPAFLNARIYSSFRFLQKADVCVMTDYISFPSSGSFIGKIFFFVFIIINQQNSGIENLKN